MQSAIIGSTLLTLFMKEDMYVKSVSFNHQHGIDRNELLADVFLTGKNDVDGYHFWYYALVYCADFLSASDVQIAVCHCCGKPPLT